jgi:hypothetical protein
MTPEREDYVPVGIERFSASVADKHMACHASANLEAAIPGLQLPIEDRTVENAANKGTMMHKFMEDISVLTPAELLGLAKAIEYIATLRKKRRFKMEVELKGSGWWLSQNPGTTADVVLYVKDELHVVDYKFGKIKVEVDDNGQLLFYGLAFSPLAPKAKGVWVHIVQPFADNIESVYFTAAELEKFRVDSANADRAIQAGSVTFGPTDKGCTFCPANPHSRGQKASKPCPAMMAMLYPPKYDEDALLADDE